jgi:Transposase, Mutator family
MLTLTSQRAPLSEAVRLAAQQMLQKAVELEVSDFLGRRHNERKGEENLRGYRNGYEGKQVQTGEGPLHLKMPKWATPSQLLPGGGWGCLRSGGPVAGLVNDRRSLKEILS